MSHDRVLPVFDLVVAGGAASGLALAAAVKQALCAPAFRSPSSPAPPPAPVPAHPPLSKFFGESGPGGEMTIAGVRLHVRYPG